MAGAVPLDDLPANLVPASDLPGNAAPAAPAASQRDVRMAEPPTPKRARIIGGDAGASLDAADAFGAANAWLDRVANKAGGAVTDAAAAASGKHTILNPAGLTIPPEAAAALGTGVNMGIGALPTIPGGEAGKLANPAVQNLGRKVMASALKPDKFARESGEGARAVETLLKEGFNVTEGGVKAMSAEIDKLDAALAQAILNAPDASTIPVIKSVQSALARFKYGLDHAENDQAIRAELAKFFAHPEVQGAFQIPAEVAQQMKRGIYRELGDRAYGIGLKSDAEREGKKAVAHGLKESLDRAVPGSQPINERMGDLVNARDLVQQRVLVAQNRNPLGLGALVNPAHWPLWIMDRNESLKSVGARALYSGDVPERAGQVVGAGVGATSERSERPQRDSR